MVNRSIRRMRTESGEEDPVQPFSMKPSSFLQVGDEKLRLATEQSLAALINEKEEDGLKELVAKCNSEVTEKMLNVLGQSGDDMSNEQMQTLHKLLSSDKVIR